MREHFIEWFVFTTSLYEDECRKNWHGPYLSKKLAIIAAENMATYIKPEDVAYGHSTIDVVHRETTNIVVKTIVPEPIPTTGDDDEVQKL